MKKLVILAAFSLSSFAVIAQKEIKKIAIAAGPIVNFPAGTVGLGAEAEISYPVLRNLEVFAQAGVASLLGRKIETGLGTSESLPATTFIPALGGVRIISGGVSFGAAFGYGSFSNSNYKYSGFTYSPQVGYNIDRIEAIVNYTVTRAENDNTSLFGVKIFYRF